jgi:hypothetical protein
MAVAFLQFTERCNICHLRKIWITSNSRGRDFVSPMLVGVEEGKIFVHNESHLAKVYLSLIYS